MRLSLLLSVALLLPSGADAQAREDPAVALCERYEDASSDERAQRLVVFHEAIGDLFRDSDEALQDAACLVRGLGKLDRLAREYCTEREKRGHGLVVDQVKWLSSEMESKRWKCQRERMGARQAAWKRVEPKTCAEIAEARLAYVEALSELGSAPLESWAACHEQALAAAAPSIVRLCEEGAISLDAAQVELQVQVKATCGDRAARVP
ncbi:MAG TPA: hypothetical protein VFT98_13880 [Myxococcota bacterium]|nr:hypothetical protein [Myxococcota bacterium]